MCGIAGYISKDALEMMMLEAMRDVFPYRGPDDKGAIQFEHNKIGLAHRRLSIIDTSNAGHQPMQYLVHGIWITFNGEIYNYLELREELSQKGYEFQTGTDTEVIMAAYLEWGQKCVSHFNGMWAFALFDLRKRLVFLSRDRLGIKPLYYYRSRQLNTLFFASEIKSILAALKTSPSVNHQLVDLYMSFGYVPGEETLLKGMMRLLPGHNAIVDFSGKITISQFWDLEFSNNKDLGLTHYLEKGKELLNSAIDLRLRSDVPLGIFLSGGVDSSAVVGLLAQRTQEQLKTFSVAYDFGGNFNETRYARIVAEKFGTEHHEIVVTPKQFVDFIPDYVSLMDEPVTEAAAISLYFVSKLASNYVTVVLSGEGSDEIFAGYDFYKYMLFLERYRQIFGEKFAELISSYAMACENPWLDKICKYVSLGGVALEQRYKGISTYDEKMKEGIYSSQYHEYLSSTGEKKFSFLRHLFDRTKGCDSLSRMLYFDTKTWLVDDLLIKADRMSMATSLELRVPFLDYRLVEFAASLPSQYKVRYNKSKYLLKKMIADILPHQIIHRKKMGFPTPLKHMFENELKNYVYDIVGKSNAHIYQYFDRKKVISLLDAHTAGDRDHHRIIWQLIVLEQWLTQ